MKRTTNKGVSDKGRTSARSPRKKLSADVIADLALAVADRQGLRKVTIRAVAKAANVSPMALYTYFASKDELYDAMFARVLGRAFDRIGRPTWQLEIDAGCRQARALLSAHREWLPLLTRVTVPSCSLPLYEHLLELTAADGMSPVDTMFAASSAISFTVGTVLVERMMMKSQDALVPVAQLALVSEMLRRTAVPKSPLIASTTAAFEQWTFDAVFEHGVRWLIAGIELKAGLRPAEASRERDEIASK